MRTSFKWIHLAVYALIITALVVEYHHWLNPLGLKPEANPKQHDGSRDFTPPREWESNLRPSPDEDGVTRFLDPWELHHHGKESEKELDLKIE